jgi:predicted nuclease of predicted toxin-antitoxin system
VKLLLDSCVWGQAAVELQAAGHDVVWAGDWPADPGDQAILAHAHAEERVLVTLDKDFGELAIVHGHLHHGIVRIVNFSARQQAAACLAVLAAHGDELAAGAIVTVEVGRMRIRPSQGSGDEAD